ncbi:MAG: NifB/NifX family molybdenum-iron cluster-binding protein [Nitrososphaerales archaeon]
MKVAVSATDGSLDAQVDPRFGRCQYLVVVDTDAMAFEVIQNRSVGAMGGAGIQAAQMVVGKGVQAVITGKVGPNAYQVLSSAGIRVMVGAFGTVRDVVESFKRGQLQEVSTSGRGMGRGMDMGRGIGRGTGRGMRGFSVSPFPQISMPALLSPFSKML